MENPLHQKHIGHVTVAIETVMTVKSIQKKIVSLQYCPLQQNIQSLCEMQQA